MRNWLSPNPFRSDLTERSRADYEEQVKGPGKFGGEEPYVPYFYDVMTHGFVEDEASWPDGGGWVGLFVVSEEDQKLFPELTLGQKIAIYERSDGLVEEMKPADAEELMTEMHEAFEETL